MQSFNDALYTALVLPSQAKHEDLSADTAGYDGSVHDEHSNDDASNILFAHSKSIANGLDASFEVNNRLAHMI